MHCSHKTATETGQQVPVPVWRARHWEAALKEQGVQDADLASRMQQNFDRSRIILFQFEPGVKVGDLIPANAASPFSLTRPESFFALLQEQLSI